MEVIQKRVKADRVVYDIFATLALVTLANVYQNHYKQSKDELFTQQRLLNNTILSDNSYLVFNRVPKAGSEMLWSLIDKLALENNFTSYSDSMKAKDARGSENTYIPNPEGRKYYVDMWRPKTLESVKNVKDLNNMKSGKLLY